MPKRIERGVIPKASSKANGIGSDANFGDAVRLGIGKGLMNEGGSTLVLRHLPCSGRRIPNGREPHLKLSFMPRASWRPTEPPPRSICGPRRPSPNRPMARGR